MARHQDLTKNHVVESWVYANAAARNSATGFVPGDVGRLAYQLDTGGYWRCIGVLGGNPSWAPYDPAHPFTQALPANPTGTTNTTGVMMGVGGSASYTPVRTGRVLVVVSGTMSNNTASDGAKAQIRHGTGAAPANGAALTGTADGNQPQAINNASTAALRTGFCCQAVISGLTLGTPYWFDLSLAAITLGTANMFDLCIDIIEL